MMMSNRRLFAGFTSWMSNFCLFHFSSRGPGGTRASRSMSGCLTRGSRRFGMRALQVEGVGLHRDGEAQVARRDQRREADRERAATGIDAWIVDAHRLKHRPGAV